MKSGSYILTYLSALVIGILLLIFHSDTTLFEGIVITIGILFVVPSAAVLVSALIPKKDEKGEKLPKPWLEIVCGSLGCILGIWMLCWPSFFISFTVYTLGIILILLGLAGLVYIILAARPYSANPWWYVMPALTLCAGVVVIVCGPDSMASFSVILTGITLIAYAVNGIASLGRESHTQKQIER